MVRSVRKPRAVLKTALIVGEGFDEWAFLKHLIQAADVRGSGTKYTIENAKGGGAVTVVAQTIRFQQRGGYDRVATLLDTDANWTTAVKKTAKDYGITVFPSSPCFECMLLRAIDVKIPDASKVKDQFSPYVNGKSTEPASYEKHFNLEALQKGRDRDRTLDSLLKFFGV